MKVVIFCGGYGTRFNNGNPGPLKPLIKIHKEEILKKILKIFSNNSRCSFILLGGYRFKELDNFSKKYRNKNLTVLNTGLGTKTGGRLLQAKELIGNSEFVLTYGDSLANFNLEKALKLKHQNNFVVSVFKYKLPYGTIDFSNKNLIKNFLEKKMFININAGFYILDNTIFDYIKSKKDSLEDDVLPKALKSKKKIIANFVSKWSPMDDLSDKLRIEKLIKTNKDYYLT
jgi:glucose-1-phosphate cytidylyltransferase